jgi:hypothetical protein
MTQNKTSPNIAIQAFLLLLGLLLYFPITAQHYNKANLEKYWRYRERLQRDFLVVSGSNTSGTNIPAIKLFFNGDGSKSVLDWGDANANMSHYISMLATEYRLLKNNGGNYQQTLTELYYAIEAIKRVDRTSESRFRTGHAVSPADNNGWAIRSDVDQPFWDTYHTQLGVSDGSEWGFRATGNPFDVYADTYENPNRNNKYYLESLSQDNVYHLLEALALVNALVEPESVVVPGQIITVDFPFEAKNLALASIQMMIHNDPIYLMHKSGNHFQCEMSKPQTWQWVLTPDWALLQATTYTAMCSLKSKWYIKNPITGALAMEGAGDDFDTWLYFCYGVSRAGNKIINPFPFGTVNLTQTEPANGALQEEVFFSIMDGSYNDDLGVVSHVFTDLVSDGILGFLTSSTVGLPPGTIPPGVAGDIVHKLILDSPPIDPYKVKSLATTGKIGGDNTFWALRDNERSRYLHFQLMYLALHGAPANYTTGSAAYTSDKQYYESFLGLAPCSGPRSYTLFTGDDYSEEWATPSRLVWPEDRGKDNNNIVDYNGLDYMMLHNLYCLAYGQDFRKLTVKESDDYTGLYDFENAVDIIANNVITPFATGSYVASHSIRLIPGFQTQTYATFSARIVPAPVDYAGFSQFNECSNLPSGARVRSVESSRPTAPSPAEPKLVSEEQASSLQIYPNPTAGIFVVKLLPNPKNLDDAMITISNITGTVVHQQSFSNLGEAIDLSQVTEGMYFITVNTPAKIYQSKLVVR